MSDEKLKNEDVDPVDVPLITSEDRAQSPCYRARLDEQDDRIRGSYTSDRLRQVDRSRSARIGIAACSIKTKVVTMGMDLHVS